MRISSGLLAATLLAAAGAAAAEPERAGPSQSALQRVVAAYQSTRQEAVIPALAEVVATGDASARFFAEFYLARAYAEGTGKAANRTKAYVLFRKIADENVEVDPERSQRAPFVAKALIALAGYVRTGIEEIDLPANPRRAADYLEYAAIFFGDRDAQLELARTYLSGSGGSDQVKLALHYLSVLTEASHPAAQATLADLFWSGRHLKKDEARALALASVALVNAPAGERPWIEASYTAMFCAAPPATREAAGGFLARWRKTSALPSPEPSVPAAGASLPERDCGNIEGVAMAAGPRAPVAADAALPAVGEASQGVGMPLTLFRAAGMLETGAKK
jgi:hypothetical protein